MRKVRRRSGGMVRSNLSRNAPVYARAMTATLASSDKMPRWRARNPGSVRSGVSVTGVVILADSLKGSLLPQASGLLELPAILVFVSGPAFNLGACLVHLDSRGAIQLPSQSFQAFTGLVGLSRLRILLRD